MIHRLITRWLRPLTTHGTAVTAVVAAFALLTAGGGVGAAVVLLAGGDGGPSASIQAGGTAFASPGSRTAKTPNQSAQVTGTIAPVAAAAVATPQQQRVNVVPAAATPQFVLPTLPPLPTFRPLPTLRPLPTFMPLPTLPAYTPPPPPPADAVVKSCIAGEFTGWSGDTVFDLCNGQVWLQSSYAYTYHYAYRPQVTIVLTGAGYEMFVEGVSKSIVVTQVTDFIRTCIDGDFEGWDGDTIFELCNGQIWQQASLGLQLSLRLRPAVLIYQTGYGYRMQVEGVDDTIAVVRLQ